MKVSVIIPVYNKEKVLRECIESVRRQTYDDIEIILVDDGSLDDSYGVMEELASRDSRIRTVSQKNAGPGAARNTGLLWAQGEYILFIDADDSIEKNMIETMLNVKCEQPDIVICGYNEYYDDSNEIRMVYENRADMNTEGIIQIISKWKDSPLIGAPWNKIYRTSLIKDNGIRFPEKQSWGEDLLFNISALEKAKSISIIEDCLYNYKRVDGSLSKTNHIKYGDSLNMFWKLKFHAYNKLKELFINKHASKVQLLAIKELELTYVYSIIHLECKNKGITNLVKLTKRIIADCDINASEMSAYKKTLTRKAYVRAGLICYCNPILFCIFEKIFYTTVRIVRSIQRVMR